jgi:hypothetical protein
MNVLRKKGEVDNIQLGYRSGRINLLMRLLYRMTPSLVRMEPVVLDLRDYDIICFGISVGAGYPPAIMSKYLQVCKNINKKKVVCFFVYAVEESAQRCTKYVNKILEKKGNPIITNVFVPWTKVYDTDYLEKVINEAVIKLGL